MLNGGWMLQKKTIKIGLLACLLMPMWAQALNLGTLRADEVAVFAQNVQTKQVVAEHRADALMNPASTMKLVTAWHSLNVLGAQHRVHTYWHSRAPIENGVLKGDLVWRGSGDPLLNQEDVLGMMKQLQAQGIRHIQGKLVLDESLWQNIPTALNFNDDGEAAFTVNPHPHMLNYHVVWLQYSPNEAARWQVHPPLAHVTVNDDLVRRVGNGACGMLKRRLKSDWSADNVIVLRGNVTAACAQNQLYSKGVVGAEYAHKAFLGLWQSLGGTGAQTFSVSQSPIPAGRVLSRHASLPVSEMVNRMNKYSNNVIARSLVLLAHPQNQGDGAQALSVLRQRLTQAPWDTKAWVVENGSGLSRIERVSARSMSDMLKHIDQSAMQAVFRQSLPIAGIDGTLRNRLQSMRGQLFLKTGTLNGVKALAGYGVNKRGQTIALSIFINGPEANHTTEQLDALAMRIMDLAQ